MNTFEPFSPEHIIPVLCFSALGLLAVVLARGRSLEYQKAIGLVLSLLVLAAMVGGSVIKLNQGIFDIKKDLPLYLCRIVAWMLPVVIWRQSRFWLRIFYFWVLAGTLQGIVTPDLDEGFPNYFYFRYWFLHAGLVVVILYSIIVFHVRISWRDFWIAVGLSQLFVIVTHGLNMLLGSNYSYTMQKPPGPSVLDLFGPWPWYILGGELLMFVLFGLLMLPWLKTRHS